MSNRLIFVFKHSFKVASAIYMDKLFRTDALLPTISTHAQGYLIGQIQLVIVVKISRMHLIGKIMTGFYSVIYYHFQPKISQWIDQVC